MREVFPPVTTNDWPINYVDVFGWRQRQVLMMRDNPDLAFGAMEYYAAHPVEFINHWCDTYDPRNAGTTVPPRMPFVLFTRQAELIEFLHRLLHVAQLSQALESFGLHLYRRCSGIDGAGVCLG